MNSLKLVYYILSSIVFILLAWAFKSISRSKIPAKNYYYFPIGMALVTVPVYSLFVSAKTYFSAMLFDALYFACTDWLCFCMLIFTLAFTWRIGAIMPVVLALAPLAVIDTVSLIMNTWRQHSFNLTREVMENGLEYWSCQFTSLHYVHLGLCYVMFFSSLCLLVHAIVTSPTGYKAKHVAVLSASFVVIIANAICYSLDLAIDFSVLLYPLFGIFVYYYSVHLATRQLLTRSLTSVNENIDDAILYFDTNDDCFYKNSQARKLFDINGEFSHNKARNLLKSVRAKIQDYNEAAPVEFFTVNGQERQFEIEAEDVYYGYSLIGSYLRLTDKTDEINKYLTQKFLANHDELTGAYTREYFFKLCDEKIKENPNTEYLMISSNIRQFKLVNELFGEEVGNKILIKMVTTTKMLAIHDSVLGRVGDDRFGLLAQKQYFTEDMIKSFLKSSQEVLEGSNYTLNLCVGICEARGPEESAQLLYDKTQLAIKKICDDYQKHLAYYDSDMMAELLRERQIVTEFEDALKGGQIKMRLQPYFDRDGNAFGGEALARWEHPQRGTLEPEVFIPPLERSGLIHKLDTFIWEQAAQTLEEWGKKGYDTMQISVNVSAKDIFYIDIADNFKQLLLKHTFNPQNLKIEFTEEALNSNLNSAITLFEKLKQIGYEVGIDDFGQGYSSLNFLKDVNADILKMDMALVQKNENTERVKVILKFIVQIAQALGMKLVSEGVETAEQLEMLRSLGFPSFQGFLFSKPLPIKDFEEKYL